MVRLLTEKRFMNTPAARDVDEAGYYARIEDPLHIHEWWPLVRDDIDRCRVQDTDEVWAEDVYAAAVWGRSRVLVIRNNYTHEYAGMAVVNVHVDPFTPRRSELLVWFCATCSDRATDTGLEALKGLAMAEGLTVVSFRGSRQAFDRWGKKHGFEFADVGLFLRVDR